MYGAILGDIIGSPYEFDRGDKSKDSPLFTDKSQFTDDTVMTVAVAEALMETDREAAVDEIESAVKKQMQAWGKEYPDSGYGGRFKVWLQSPDPQPYDSWGNGSAMRVSAAGWLYDTLERTCEVAKATAVVSHNHPEGIAGAQATAAAIYMARNGASKQEIKEHIEETYGYDLDRTLDEIRPTYHHVESCQETVPEAIIAFLEADSFEDTIRGAVSLGGDTDTLGAIAGSIAEAYYGIPENLIEEGRKRLTPDILRIVDVFYTIAPEKIPLHRKDAPPTEESGGDDSVREQILAYAKEGGKVYVPYEAAMDQDHVAEVGQQVLSGSGTPEQTAQVHLLLSLVRKDDDPGLLIPVFTTKEYLERWPEHTRTTQIALDDVLELAVRVEAGGGVIVNPLSDDVCIEINMIEEILGKDRAIKAIRNPITSSMGNESDEDSDAAIQDIGSEPRPLGTAELNKALANVTGSDDEKAQQEAVDALQACLKNGADVFISYYAAFDQQELDHLAATALLSTSNDPITLPFRIVPNIVTAVDEIGDWFPAFTNWDELEKAEIPDLVARIPLLRAMQLALQEPDSLGLLINPFGNFMQLPKVALTEIIRTYATSNN